MDLLGGRRFSQRMDTTLDATLDGDATTNVTLLLQDESANLGNCISTCCVYFMATRSVLLTSVYVLLLAHCFILTQNIH